MGRGTNAEAPMPVPQLVLSMRCDQPTAAPSRHRLDGLDEVRFGRGPALVERDVRARRLTIRLPDPRMSSDHGRLVREGDTWVLDDPASKNGCVWNGTLTRRELLGDGDVLELGHTFFLMRVASPAPGAPDLDALALAPAAPELVTFAGGLAESYARLARVGPTDVPVLIVGETGTGKELVARAVHTLSGRRGPFVAVNCGALPETLVEAELFGARKGAFSGATGDRPGLVRGADGGTLFLDEIAELRASSQAAFLRVLQEHEVLPLGETRAIKVDVRFCAATHRHLDDMVKAGGFRDDLYARLYGYTIELPPLRARREDLGLLVRALLLRRPGGERATFTPAAVRLLFAHDWPHNVRELEKTLAAAVALADGRAIDVGDLGDLARRVATARPVATTAPLTGDDALRARLRALLETHQGNIAAVARAIGKDRMQIHRWARRLAIDLDAYRR
ncbi:MAG: sigma 54-interacting transcriptional regulator [Deltaproteobacteria bacterium]|nr:sigma 54-interacting transcriptional regulator [Deltaproteobacteria bacterium]